MLTKEQAGGPDATAVILRQCETFFQTGDTAALLTDERNEAMAQGQFRLDLMCSQLLPFLVDRVRGRFGAWYEMAGNAALQQTSDLRFIPIDDGNVITLVKQSADQTNTVSVAIALSRDVDEFWPPLGDTLSSSTSSTVILRRWRRITSPASDQPSTGAASSCGSSRTAIPPCSSVVWRKVAP